MPQEETLLEPPATPAPVFAYRALRSIFFASPDSSPEQADDNKNKNKENIFPERLSPVKSLLEDGSHVAIPSPHKRKRDVPLVVSPTKSILRTPGAPTPRAKSLRDVNVKFKSISPELRRSSAPQAHALVVGETAIATVQPLTNVEMKTSKKVNTKDQSGIKTVATRPTSQDTPSAAASTLNDELQAYMRRTEKEMKKLVRYGQKMREYARRQDEENLKLRSLLEQAQKENERLRNVQSQSRPDQQRPGKTELVGGGRDGQHISSFIPPSILNPRRLEEGNYAKGENFSHIDSRTTATTSASSKSIPKHDLPKRASNSHSQTHQQPKQQKQSKSKWGPSEQCLPLDLHLDLDLDLDVGGASALPIRNIPTGTGNGSVSTAKLKGGIGNHSARGMPPDRLAAARERVRLKAQLRRAASVEVMGGGSSTVGFGGGGESQVDWAAL